ncbi:hypothetical protein LUZ60_013661 [Juncus effusus]|nr:hypothetical protein LUZ60_013661 [Juncus effusus]
MAALQRFKLLATQCTAGPPPSPSRSPAPPCFRLHKHRRNLIHKKSKTRALRHLISAPDPEPFPDPDQEPDVDREEEKKGLLRDNSHTLRDLFVSSPKGKGGDSGGVASAGGVAGAGSGRSVGGWRLMGLRNRLLRRAWRPVLVAIPE